MAGSIMAVLLVMTVIQEDLLTAHNVLTFITLLGECSPLLSSLYLVLVKYIYNVYMCQQCDMLVKYMYIYIYMYVRIIHM